MVVARKAAETQAVMLPDGGFARSAVDVVDRANLGALATFDAEVRIYFEFAVGDYLVKEYATDDSAVKPAILSFPHPFLYKSEFILSRRRAESSIFSPLMKSIFMKETVTFVNMHKN